MAIILSNSVPIYTSIYTFVHRFLPLQSAKQLPDTAHLETLYGQTLGHAPRDRFPSALCGCHYYVSPL